ncbi:glycoside hydrolase family 43 protein [Saccharothrix saharensis]|uniref:glycoside hydrolase family 43 protein n=1 Tax=Saccharothrix saharensis TaxID=571190 RepID=UPI003686464B
MRTDLPVLNLTEPQTVVRYYDNPVIGGFHPDPSVCRVGEDYYLVCSSFEYFPGVPIFHSRDLVHWRQIGNVLDRTSQLPPLTDAAAFGGIYAPTIRHHDGRFWLITTNVSHGGNFVVTAERPEGPWSDPVWIDLPGIDPDLAWDLYRVGEWWYLLIAEGGTERGHTVAMARARTPRGPWQPAPTNPILTHRGTDLPIQSTGHADLVTTPDGDWWMVLLATRPRGFTPGFHVLGRETFLTPVDWVDGWPRVGPVKPRERATGSWQPVEPYPTRDDFDTADLAPQWISPYARPRDSWSLVDRPGWLTLHATGSTLDRPGATFVGRRQQHPDCRAAVRLDPGSGRAGLSVRLDEAHHYDLEVVDGRAAVIARIGPLRERVADGPVPPGPVTLVITTRTAGVDRGAPDVVGFHVDDDPVPLAELDGRYLSTEVATGFTGRVIGMYVTEGTACFDWFDYEPTSGTRHHGPRQT